MSPLLIGSSDLAPDWAAATLATTFASVVPQSNSTRAHGHYLLNPRVRRRCVSPAHLVDRTPTHSTHLCSTVCSKARNAHHALGSRLKNCITSLCAWKESVIWFAHVSSFVVLSPAVHFEHLIFLTHSSFHHDTRTRSTIRTTRSTPRTPSTSSIPFRLSQSTSSAIKSHSGVKTCRVAETRTRQLPQVMSPKSL